MKIKFLYSKKCTVAEEKIISTLAFWLPVQPARACQHGNDTGSRVWLNSNKSCRNVNVCMFRCFSDELRQRDSKSVNISKHIAKPACK